MSAEQSTTMPNPAVTSLAL